MTDPAIDLRSDTKTRPCAGMRAAMAAADVGDEQQDEDPTVTALTERVAALLGKEAAIFLPSGTMANAASLLVHCGRGEVVFCEATSHLLHYETGGAAGLAGAMVTALAGEGGIFETPALEAALRGERRNAPRPRLVWVEQTTNMGGGRVWPLATLRRLRAFATSRRLALHIDGARLLNASRASGVDAADYCAEADSAWIDFSKGLGAPFGAVLAGDRGFVEAARRYKHMLGGAMRQAGIMAAACVYALDHTVSRLDKDHDAAQRLARGLAGLPGLHLGPAPETNIVMLTVAGGAEAAAHLARRLAERGVRVGVFDGGLIRLVTHRDIPPNGIELAISAFQQACGTEP